MNKRIGEILNSSLEIQLNELLKLSTQTNPPKNKEYVAAIIEKIYINNTSLSERFSIKTVSDYLIEKIKEILSNESKGSEDAFRIKIEKAEIFTKDNTNKIFNELLEIKPQKIKIFSPISGITLEKDVSPFKIGPFEIIKGTDIKQPFVINSSLHIYVTLHDIYDLDIAISKANDAFKDFIRLVVFISGRNDKNIEIKIGLPILTDMSKDIVYRDSESYFIENEIGEFESLNIKNNIVKKIPIDNEYFFNNENFKLLWSLYNTREKKAKKTTMKERLLNSSLALGQSMHDRDIKNSIIYTCI